jgi:prepilin-type N-terminal cleavage/methylation domain-containing protein
MKKMYNYRRRGFTLLEIIVVVAIIVVLSGAAFVGVAVTLERAKNKGDAASAHGQDFEDVAWNQVREIAVGAADFFQIYEYTPQTPAPTPADGENEEELSSNSPTSSPTPTPKLDVTNTPTPTPVATNTPTPKPTNNTNPHIAATYTSTSPNTNATGSNVSKNSDVQHDINYVWNASKNANDLIPKNTKITTTGSISAGGSKIEEVYITVPSGTQRVEAGDWRYTVEKVDDTHYKIWYSAAATQGEGHYQWSPPFTNLSYKIYEEHDDPNITASEGIIVTEYSTSI